MHIETVRFERVFDVGSGCFSFEGGAGRQFSVAFDHKTVPDVGATYAVALDQPGNWQTVIGWRDLSTSMSLVKFKRSGWEMALSDLLDFCLVGIFIPIAALVFGGMWAGLLALVLMLLGSAVCIRRAVLYHRKIERALRAVPAPDEVTELSQRARIVA